MACYNLTVKQEKFCLVYIKTGNASEAYRQSYNCSNSKPASINRRAKELMDNGKIQARMAELKAELKEEIIVDCNYVLKTIKDTIERCSQAVPVLDKEGMPTGEYEFDSRAVLKGAELLGKHLIMFTDKIEHKHLHEGKVEHEHKIDPKQLEKMEKSELIKTAFDKLRGWREKS